MDLSIVKRRLESKAKEGECYVSPDGFVADVRLIFFNCAKYYKVSIGFHKTSLMENEPVTCKNKIIVVLYHKIYGNIFQLIGKLNHLQVCYKSIGILKYIIRFLLTFLIIPGDLRSGQCRLVLGGLL